MLRAPIYPSYRAHPTTPSTHTPLPHIPPHIPHTSTRRDSPLAIQQLWTTRTPLLYYDPPARDCRGVAHRRVRNDLPWLLRVLLRQVQAYGNVLKPLVRERYDRGEGANRGNERVVRPAQQRCAKPCAWARVIRAARTSSSRARLRHITLSHHTTPHHSGAFARCLLAGTYTLESASTEQLQVQRRTGDNKYTDKITFTLTPSGAGCKMDSCSESQVNSITDYSTNYCNSAFVFVPPDVPCATLVHLSRALSLSVFRAAHT